MKEPIIQIKGVSKHFFKRQVLKLVNLDIKENSILGIVGQSGAGKTTLIRLILGIYAPTSGDIFIEGKPQDSDHKNIIGFASQEYSFYPRLTVTENLDFYGTMYNLSKRQRESRTKTILEHMELTQARKTKASKLSGGMKRRLDIGIALITRPKILIFDEPTTGLDIVLKEKMWNIIKKIKQAGTTIIICSHDLRELEEHCTELAFVRDGHVYTPEMLKKYLKKYKPITLSGIFKAWYIEQK